jgi:thiamine kinase-like enzyme
MADQITGCHVTDAEVAVDAMAALHAHSWSGSRFADMPWLPSYADPPFPQVIAGMYKQSWPRALELAGERMPANIRNFGERYEELVPWFLEQLSQEPLTFCHGDFRLDNLFFGPRDGKPPVTIVDWQICFRGRAGYDFGYFVSQSLTPEDRRECEGALMDRYLKALAALGVEYPRDELVKDYKRTTAWCFIYPIVSIGQVEFANERQMELIMHAFLDRAMAAIEDTGALDILPS